MGFLLFLLLLVISRLVESGGGSTSDPYPSGAFGPRTKFYVWLTLPRSGPSNLANEPMSMTCLSCLGALCFPR